MQATTAVREASNQVFLLDQIYNKTGLVVDVVDMPKEIYTKFVAIRNTLKSEKISTEREGMLMMDISSGGLGVTLVRDEKSAIRAISTSVSSVLRKALSAIAVKACILTRR